MPIDINSFRTMSAKTDGSSLLYVQGDQLKSTTAQKSGGSAQFAEFKAATTAFLDSFKAHYGARLGQMAANTLQEYVEMGRPLSASAVSQLITFADKFVDENMGSRDSVKVGDVVVDLAKIKTDKMRSTGVFKSTQIRNAQEGGAKAAARAFAALAPSNAGRVDIKGLLRQLETLHAYAVRDATASGTLAAGGEATSFEKLLFKGVDSLDNNALSSVYQGLVSREADALKKELARIVDRPNADLNARARAERFFTDLSRMEAMVVSEVSRRMALAKAPENEVQNVPSLMAKYCGDEAVAANRFGGDKDMTTLNLGLMTRLAAQGSVNGGRIDAQTNATLKKRQLNDVDSKKIGDMIRGNELTINFHLGAVMGWRRNGTVTTSLFKKPNAQILNTFRSKEEQNLPLDGTGELKFRNQIEQSFFPEYSTEPLKGRDRPAYGALNIKQYTSGAADTANGAYGHVVVVLKEHVKRQCTYVLGDTFFVSTLNIAPEMRQALEEAVVNALAPSLRDPEAALAEIRADAAGVLGKRFQALTPGKATYNQAFALSEALAEILNRHLAEGARQLDGYDVFACLTERHANRSDNQKNVATYDNVENLLEGQGEFTALNMAVATMKRQADPNYRIAFESISYIEAQIHGPIALDRDVEEVRIDVSDFEMRAANLYQALPPDQKAAIEGDARLGPDRFTRRQAWKKARADEMLAQVKAEVKGAPFKVTFYDVSEERIDADDAVRNNVTAVVNEAVNLIKDDLVAAVNSLISPEGRAKVVARTIEKAEGTEAAAKQLWGENLENAPDWFTAVVDAAVRNVQPLFGVDSSAPKSEEEIVEKASNEVYKALLKVSNAVARMDALGIQDADERLAVLKSVVENPVKADYVADLVNLHAAAAAVRSDLDKLVADTFEKDIPFGADLMRLAYNGVPPVGGRARDKLIGYIENEIREIRGKIAEGKITGNDASLEKILERLRQRVVKPFVEKKAQLLACQANWAFPSDGERNAFITWAVSAGSLRHFEEFKGVYESSTKLTDALAEKLANGATPTAEDIVDAYKAFYPTCYEYIQQTKAADPEFGADDLSAAVSRAASVAMSRLAVRLGNDAMLRLAAAFDSPEARALYVSTVLGSSADNQPGRAHAAGGEFMTFAMFMPAFYERLPEKFGAPLEKPSTGLNIKMPVAAITPATRRLLRRINPTQADFIDATPYDPNAAGPGFRRLVHMAPPASPAQMPQGKAARKAFLLEMLPTYHNHEKTFDKGTNYHGRTHATRSFVLSIAMGNILKAQGVRVDMNAVALATAGHDTGRLDNGEEGNASEARSGDNVNAAIERLYPGAAGDAWKAQVKANITTDAAGQTTIEGHLFKCADSLDYFRVGPLRDDKFPFLREDLVTDDGVVVAANPAMRRQLMKEAKRLTSLTSPRIALRDQVDAIDAEIVALSMADNVNEVELEVKRQEKARLVQQMREGEIRQTEDVSDEALVEMVENAIRDNPNDFPLLTKYYLNAQ